MDIYNFWSLFGIAGLVAIGWLFSTNRTLINWHVVVWGVGLQMLFAWFLFVFPAGIKFFLGINDLVVKVLDCALAGSRFVFGRLAVPPGMEQPQGEGSLGFFLAFQAFPTIIFFSSLMSILYFWNVMPRIIKGFSFLFTRLMRVSGAEALCASSNIFVGVESALTVKPLLKDMTRSELCVVLTAGMATVASNVMAVYVFSLRDVFPTIAGHLVSASLLSAPAALAMSKVLLPETEIPQTLGEDVGVYYEKDKTFFEAIMTGAHSGVRLIVGIVALLIAILGIVALGDLVIGFLGEKLNVFWGWNFDWSLKSLMGFVFTPLVLLLGVPLNDVPVLAQLIGERLIVTEVVAYQDLASMMAQSALHSPRSAVIAAYALCGFAHLASMAIFVGGVSALAPEKTRTLAQVGLRALFAANLACLMTACVAGVFFTRGSLLLDLGTAP